MYHRVGRGKHANSKSTLIDHFDYIRRFPNVLPGEPLKRGKTSICLTFDDATFDFYHYVFPLLKEYNLRAVLGVPVRYILEKTELTAKERLSIPYTMAMQDGFFEQKAPFCTWEELREMVASGLVHVASHSFAHCNLTFPFVNLQREVIESKRILEEQLDQPISSFIYPFGRVNRRLHEFVMQHYRFAFRIGSAVNWRWSSTKRPISRIKADNTEGEQLLSPRIRSLCLLKGIATPFLPM